MLEFKEITSILALNKYQVTKYQSRRTGLSVIITNNEVATVHCTILIVTEPEDDEGYIHAIEHLILNGSQKHPYKGVLERLDGDVCTWAENDCISLKFSSTGQSQALAVLPIFLEHVMFPLFSEEDFALDVHHIDGEGKDGGLVYEEMKDAYQFPYKRLLNKFMKAMYPNSSYSYDSNGSDLALRQSTSNSKVKEFHKKYFRPENITILLTGVLSHEGTLKMLTEFEDEIISKRNSEPPEEWEKPWQTVPPPPIYGEHNSFHSITCPDIDGHEKDGHIVFGWRGPVLSDATGLKELAACEILLDYLSRGTRAPFLKWLVDAEDPLSIVVSSNIDSIKISLLRLEIFNIPMEKMEQAKYKTLEFLKNIRTGATSLDMDRIKELLEDEMKDESTNKIPLMVHLDIVTKYRLSLYLETDEFAATMNPQWHLNELSEANIDYWLNIFRKYFTDDTVIVNGIPIDLENEEIEEKQRIEKQRETLGDKGLAEMARLLEKAKKYREVSILSESSDFHI